MTDSFIRDVFFSLRQLRKSPGFALTAILMLALGLCASLAIFAFVDAALVKPLPYRDPQKLVAVFEVSPPSCPKCNLSYPDYLDWKQRNSVFQSLEIYRRAGFVLTSGSGVEPVRGARVSGGFFRTLGVTPVLGRDFVAGEDSSSAAPTAILSHRAWRQRYDGSPAVIGKTVTLDGEPVTIVGVLPRDFHFAPAEPAEYWTVFHAKSECDLRRSCHGIYGIARLKEGVSQEAALTDITRIAKQLEQQYPDSNRDQGAALSLLSEAIVGTVRPILLALLSGSGLLLLIATVNVASLVLARSESRRRELAVRTALGAGRGRLIRLFLTESLVLVTAGSAAGLFAAWWAIQLLIKLVPANMLAGMPYLTGLGLNFRLVSSAAAFSFGTMILFSLTPALHASFSKLRDGLAEGGRGSAGTAWRRLGSKLAVVELACATVLLVSAGLMVKSLYLLLHVSIGIQPDHVATMYVAAPKARYTNPQQTIQLAKQVIARVTSLPGVKQAAITSDIPVTHWGDTTWLRILGRPWHGEHNDTPQRDVSPAYFETLGAKISQGRSFTESDDSSKPLVAIVNRTFEKMHFPGAKSVGQRVSFLSPSAKPIEIVGVVEDIKEGQLDSVNRPAIYFPMYQNSDREFYLVVRASQADAPLLPEINAAIHEIDRDITTTEPSTMNDRVDNSASAYMHRSSAWLTGAFAFVALALSAVGLYGVIAYSVTQRTREIGIRMALGARRGSVYALVFREGGWIVIAGLGIGVIASTAMAGLIRSLLFGVQSWDLPTLVIVIAVLAFSALLASFVPARRAAGVNPVEALRAE